MVRILATRRHASETHAVKPKKKTQKERDRDLARGNEKSAEAGVMDLNPTAEDVECLRGRHMQARTNGRISSDTDSPRHTLRPLRRSSSRIQRWVQDQQKRLSASDDDIEGANATVAVTSLSAAAASASVSTELPASTPSASGVASEPPTTGIRVVEEPKAEPEQTKRLPGTKDATEADDAKTSAEQEQTAQDDEELDYVVIDAELGDALRNASVTQDPQRTIDLTTSPNPSIRNRRERNPAHRASLATASLRNFALGFATPRKSLSSASAPPTPPVPNVPLSAPTTPSPQARRSSFFHRRQHTDHVGAKSAPNSPARSEAIKSRVHTRNPSLTSFFTSRGTPKDAQDFSAPDLARASTTPGPAASPSSWKLRYSPAARKHAHFASEPAADTLPPPGVQDLPPRRSTSTVRTFLSEATPQAHTRGSIDRQPTVPERDVETGTASSRTSADMLPAPPRPSTSSSRTRSSEPPFSFSRSTATGGAGTGSGTSSMGDFLSPHHAHAQSQRITYARPPSPASFFSASAPSMWSLPTDATHMRDPPGSTRVLAGGSADLLTHLHLKSPSIISSSIGTLGAGIGVGAQRRKRKLVVSGIPQGDVRRYDHVRKWCEGFGEVNQITRIPNGDLHVDFRRSEVAETVCRLHARVYITGVGSVGLSWYTGKRS